MKKRVIVCFVVCIAAVMSATAQTAESYFTAGIEKAQKGLLKEALDDFTKAIELNPKYVGSIFYFVVLLNQI
jgi:tetratricopeptide (TPR) repeat protein